MPGYPCSFRTFNVPGLQPPALPGQLLQPLLELSFTPPAAPLRILTFRDLSRATIIPHPCP